MAAAKKKQVKEVIPQVPIPPTTPPPQGPTKHVHIALPLFEIGQIVSTTAVIRHLTKNGLNVLPFVGRHVRGDWGIVSEFDKEANDRAVKEGLRIFSVYEAAGKRLWVITESDRSKTTVLFPEEY